MLLTTLLALGLFLLGTERLFRLNENRVPNFAMAESLILEILKEWQANQTPLEDTPLPAQLGKDFFAELGAPRSLLPQSFLYDIAELQALKRYATDCHTPTSHPSVKLQKSWQWHQWLCQRGKGPPEAFFSEPPFSHPNGRSFAGWYLENALTHSPADPIKFDALLPYTHLGEWRRLLAFKQDWPPHFKLFSELSPASLALLNQNTPFILGPSLFGLNDSAGFLNGRERRLKVFLLEPFLKKLESRGLFVTPPSHFAAELKDCLATYSHLCWQWNPLKRKHLMLQTILSLASAVVLLVYIIGRLWLSNGRARRREQKDRESMFRLLTHEIRTPVAAIKVQLESFRTNFDALPSPAQDAFLSISAEVERSRRVIEMSEAFVRLSAQGQVPIRPQEILSIQAFLEDQLAALNGKVTMVFPFGDFSGHLDPFWLGVCLQNLAQNAVAHGTSPVVISVSKPKTSYGQSSLEFVVQDRGCQFNTSLNAIRTRSTNSSGSKGLGIGLWLVDDLVQKMNATMVFSANPTTFTINVKQPTTHSQRGHSS